MSGVVYQLRHVCEKSESAEEYILVSLEVSVIKVKQINTVDVCG